MVSGLELREGLFSALAQDQEWKKIGARRQVDFLSLGSLPTFGHPRKILVRPSTDGQMGKTKLKIRNRKFSYSMLE